jgi:hypothetical protein
MTTVYLVMATANAYAHKPPIPLRVFEDRTEADVWRMSLIDYHITPPEQPTGADSEQMWAQWRVLMDTWRTDHPAGVAAADFDHFGVYDLPFGL